MARWVKNRTLAQVADCVEEISDFLSCFRNFLDLVDFESIYGSITAKSHKLEQRLMISYANGRLIKILKLLNKRK